MDYPKTVAGAGLQNGKFTAGNPSTGVPGSLIPASWGNAVTDEILGAITTGGLAPNEADATQLKTAIQNIAEAAIAAKSFFPVGGIVMWSGAVSAIPTGWKLCDGQNGTPDLRDRFIVGAGGAYNPADTGGEAAHTLTVDEIPSHDHSTTGTQEDMLGGPAFRYSATPSGARTGFTGGGQAHENRPPYYALAFIMLIA